MAMNGRRHWGLWLVALIVPFWSSGSNSITGSYNMALKQSSTYSLAHSKTKTLLKTFAKHCSKTFV